MKVKKPDIKELIWLFVIGCLLGFILETGWYFIKHGVIINKQGLLYGPFKPIYGFGLIIIILTMYKYQDKKLGLKFILGILVGSAFEYFGSVFQELVFGTSTWNYSTFKLNLGGRLYLPYCLIWGVLAVLVLDLFYPWFQKIMAKIPKKIYNLATYFMTFLMIINIGLTVFATIRYSARAKGDADTNVVFKLIDKTYNDEYMQQKFPKLQIIKKD